MFWHRPQRGTRNMQSSWNHKRVRTHKQHISCASMAFDKPFICFYHGKLRQSMSTQLSYLIPCLHMKQEALPLQRNRASTLSVLNSCKMLHKSSTNCIWKGLKPVNDLQGHSRSLPLLPFDRPYTISYESSIVSISVSCTVFEILTLICKKMKTSRDIDHAHLWDRLSSRDRHFWGQSVYKIWRFYL